MSRIQDAIDATQNEIFHAAWGTEPPDDDSGRDADLEGNFDWTDAPATDWGEELIGADELDEQHIPEEQHEYFTPNVQLAAEIAREMQGNQDQRFAAQREQEISAVLDAALENPGAVRDALVYANNRASQSQTNLVEAAMRDAHGRYGEEFEMAYGELASQNPESAQARQIVQGIFNSGDPGEALMAWHRSGGAMPSRQMRLPGSLNARRGSESEWRGSESEWRASSEEDAFRTVSAMDANSVFESAFEQEPRYQRNSQRVLGQYGTDDEYIFASAFDDPDGSTRGGRTLPRRSELR